MRLDKGKPSGVNKSAGSGTPSQPARDEKAVRKTKITDPKTDNVTSDKPRQMNPNRNPDKPDATNNGGYKN